MKTVTLERHLAIGCLAVYGRQVAVTRVAMGETLGRCFKAALRVDRSIGFRKPLVRTHILQPAGLSHSDPSGFPKPRPPTLRLTSCSSIPSLLDETVIAARARAQTL